MSICGWGAGGLCRITAEGPELVTLECPPICVAGRRPPAFIESRSSELGLGAYFARAAELEAASIVAFRGLRAELRAFGAPRRLLRALSRAARDEQRHARATRALARRFGARAQSVRVLSVPARSLEALATENGAEGCVRELYGALSATFQAWNAQDLQVKGALARIAREETRHAALSLSLQRWLAERLSPAARARVRDAQCRAVATLRIEIETQRALPESEVAGLPSTEQALRLFQSLSSVWAESVSPSAPG